MINRLIDHNRLDIDYIEEIKEYLIFRKIGPIFHLHSRAVVENLLGLNLKSSPQKLNKSLLDISVLEKIFEDASENNKMRNTLICIILIKKFNVILEQEIIFLMQEFVGPFGSDEEIETWNQLKKTTQKNLNDIIESSESKRLQNLNINSLYETYKEFI